MRDAATRSRQWRIDNPELVHAYSQKWRLDHPGYKKQWRKTSPVAREYDHNYTRTHRQEKLSYVKFLLKGAKSRAKQKGILFNLTDADVFMPEFCPVLGIKLISHFGKEHKHDIRKDDSPSLDRIDNSQGYVSGNVRIISWRANKLKSDGTADEHEKISKYIRENCL